MRCELFAPPSRCKQALDAMNDDLHRRFGIRLAARIGVNTGEVAVTGDGAGDAQTGMALGHAINMAARLEQAAAARRSAHRSSEHTTSQPSSIEPNWSDPLEVKGSSAPIAAWRVAGTVDGRRAGWEGEGLFVGREKELAAIESAFAHGNRGAGMRRRDGRCATGDGQVTPRRRGNATARRPRRRSLSAVACPTARASRTRRSSRSPQSSQLPADEEAVARARHALADTALAITRGNGVGFQAAARGTRRTTGRSSPWSTTSTGPSRC